MTPLRCAVALALFTSSATSSAALAAPAPAPAPVGAIAPIDHVVALVDGRPIWWSEYTEALATEPPADTEAARKALETTTLDRLIDDALLLQRAHALHIETNDTEIDAALQEIEVQNHFDQAGLEAALAQMGMSLARYRVELGRQIVELRVFMQAVPTEAASSPEKRTALRDAWIADLRRAARIERR